MVGLESFHPDLEGVLDRDQTLLGGNLVDEASKCRGLSGARPSCDDEVGARPHGR
jgi:hypothetical protein